MSLHCCFDVLQSGFTPLHIAAHYGNTSVGRLLVEKGADVNFKARVCIWLCCVHIRSDVIIYASIALLYQFMSSALLLKVASCVGFEPD